MTEVKPVDQQFHVHVEEVTLVAGAASFENPFPEGTVFAVLITQKGAAAVAESFSGNENGNDIDIDSSNGTSTATVIAVVLGIF